jgi:hypothetical protein
MHSPLIRVDPAGHLVLQVPSADFSVPGAQTHSLLSRTCPAGHGKTQWPLTRI